MDDQQTVDEELYPQAVLNTVYQQVQQAENFTECLEEIEPYLLAFLQCERITIYQKAHGERNIVSYFKTGDVPMKIELPIGPGSIAGFTAMSRQPVCITDAYDEEELQSIHEELRFNSSFDMQSGFLTGAVIAVPILYADTLLGVLQAMNCIETRSGRFAQEHIDRAAMLAKIFAKRLRTDLRTTQGPFEYLVTKGLVSTEQLEELEVLSQRTNASVGHLLVMEVGLTPDEVGASLEHYYQVPFIKYDPEMEFDRALVENLNRNYLVRNLWLPIGGDTERALILTDDPNDADKIMEIQGVLNAASYEFYVAIREDILRFLGIDIIDLAPLDDEEEEAPEVNLEDLVGQLEQEASASDRAEFKPTELVDENAAVVVKLVSKLIADAIGAGASDIHIEPSKGRAAAVVRVRVDGVCRKILDVPSSHVRAVVARIKVMSNLDITETRLPQDGKMGVRLYNTSYELRVATIATVNGESAVLRILAAGDAMPLADLNLAPRNEENVRRLLEHPHGNFLVVGPTGSGKTTTLHALLGEINTPDKKIWTIEDPVEITQAGLQQVQVNSRINFDFARGLRAFLRADPDVILIGEMRDYETAHAGVEASLTGHLVFSTLHTNSAPETITRLLDMGLDPISFADALIGVLAQRLVRTLCKECKEAYQPDENEIKILMRGYGEDAFAELGIDVENLTLYRAGGCEKCGNMGYKGRTGIHELMVATSAIKSLVARGGKVVEIREMAIQEGMRTLFQDGIYKIIKGQLDLKQVRTVTVEYD